MSIELTEREIDAAFPKVKQGLSQYGWLQSQVRSSGLFHADPEFRRRFNHFYRVRRGAAWQDEFYGIMAQAKRKHLQFQIILKLLHHATNRFEASFASKLFATLNPSAPVIDSAVLKNLDLRLPYSFAPDRVALICTLHKKLSSLFAEFIGRDRGKYLVSEFRRAYPKTTITREKMVDLVLWQTRKAKAK